MTRQQRYFAQFLPRTPEHRFVAGETHHYLGRQYRLYEHNAALCFIYLNWVVQEIERNRGEIDYGQLMPWHGPVGRIDG
ncbi:M48 family metallopeptidase [Leisingera sp. NJS201]|uniref:M48 family metallopeptidase n=1 Tax=Leisingera sp. NJS201 TaxID=2508306 RepID=UPI0020C7835B|nr:M48 family metallopeptidase [Leisingera sp. NJS201]